MFHKGNYPEVYSPSNDTSYHAVGPLFSQIIFPFTQKTFFLKVEWFNFIFIILNDKINSGQGSFCLHV